MRYQDQQLQDKLAMEYVMGLLTGQARRRFEKLLLQNPDIQTRVAHWSTRLQLLNENIEPVTPPRSVWSNILSRIDHTSPHPLWQNIIFWRRLALSASTMLVLFSVFYYFNVLPSQHVVIVMNEKAQTEWVVKASTRSRRFSVQTVSPPVLPEDKICVLWLVWKDGKTMAVGVLSDKIGKSEMLLPKDLKRKPEKANVLVSVETRGQEVETPTGKIVFNSPWVEF